MCNCSLVILIFMCGFQDSGDLLYFNVSCICMSIIMFIAGFTALH